MIKPSNIIPTLHPYTPFKTENQRKPNPERPVRPPNHPRKSNLNNSNTPAPPLYPRKYHRQSTPRDPADPDSTPAAVALADIPAADSTSVDPGAAAIRSHSFEEEEIRSFVGVGSRLGCSSRWLRRRVVAVGRGRHRGRVLGRREEGSPR